MPFATSTHGISACCVLAGGLRPTPLSRESRRCVLDLAVSDDGRTLLDALVERLGASETTASAPVFVLAGQECPRPRTSDPDGQVKVVVELDAYRGPAGAIRDAAASHGLRGPILVLEANRHYGGSFAALVIEHRTSGAAVTVAATHDGRPAGAYVVEPRVLRRVPSRGFMDLKEQFLGRLQQDGERIAVHRAPPAWTRPVRTLEDLLDAADVEAALHRGLRLVDGDEQPRRVYSAGGSPCRIVRSVVMPGATIGDGAVVTRSLLLPGAQVAPGEVVVDEVRGPPLASQRGLRRRAA